MEKSILHMISIGNPYRNDELKDELNDELKIADKV
jgi:hypothetical protein